MITGTNRLDLYEGFVQESGCVLYGINSGDL